MRGDKGYVDLGTDNQRLMTKAQDPGGQVTNINLIFLGKNGFSLQNKQLVRGKTQFIPANGCPLN